MIRLPTPQNIENALQILHGGDLIGLPTETVYGLAADATQDKAVAGIFQKKQRPTFNPLIIHSYSTESLQKHVIWNDKAEALAATFWPGPLTLILPRSPSTRISLLCSAGMETLAVRIPNHPLALQILQDFKHPLAAPSANPSGKVSPTQAQHVEHDFPDLFILEGGDTFIGLESTIVDLTGHLPSILRPGGISEEDIHSVIGDLERPLDNAIKAPGMLKSHYAPTLPLRLNAEIPFDGEAYLAFGPTVFTGSNVYNLSLSGDLTEAAANLFKMLRLLDHPSFSGISVAPLPYYGLGVALNDRLQRAAAPREL